MFDLFILTPFHEIALLLVMAAVFGVVGLWLRQPMIVSFILVGVLSAPSALGIVQSHETIDILAELGIAVLLFLVGLKLDVKLIRTLGAVSLATGLGQVMFTALIGFAIALAFGMDWVTSLYVAVALTFSSTIIVVKLLSDKKEVDALHGRIAIGMLIVQDLVVVLAMMVLSAYGIGRDAEGAALEQVGLVLVYGAILLVLVALFIRYVANPLIERVAHSGELLITFAISWAALLAVLGDTLGFSKELGGLLAGVSLASTPFREALVARLSSLRDFLLLFFFIALGAQLDIGLLGEQITLAIALSLFVLIGNPLIVMAIMGYMGYRKRTGFLTGLTVAQISEFSLIFMAMGVALGHVATPALGLVTLVGLVTIALSVYMITYSHELYRLCEPLLGVFERRIPSREHEVILNAPNAKVDVILFGLGRYGSAMAANLKRQGYTLLAIDFNPDVVQHWRALGYMTLYGDASDQEFLATLPIQHARWVISAMPQHDRGLTHCDPRHVLIDNLKQHGFGGRIALSTQHTDEVQPLLDKGADMVFLPFFDAADQAVARLAAWKAETKEDVL